ncbi:uncharacterized protein LOC123292848 [Chrysoperla carnea]|uniref:uncharacterized protein LOC123292848 n=1 Tax=Chrysoperla carnea TaxID=189513 RepID=UPI001D08FEA9|nr:uncharacterized protein LOC123292848 [Chrysoperla carnea]
MDVREIIPSNFTLVFHAHKCLGMNDLGCSEFYMDVAGKVCSHLQEETSIWYKFAQHFSVPIESCPLNSGIYYLRHLKLSLNDLNTIPMDEGYHVIKAYGYVRPEIVMCLYSEVLVTY